MITDKTRRALEIVKEVGTIRPRDFAKAMWPDSEGWERYAKCGPNGVHQGGGMYIAAGGYLGRLQARGLVRWHHLRGGYFNEEGYILADGGYKALEGGKHEESL